MREQFIEDYTTSLIGEIRFCFIGQVVIENYLTSLTGECKRPFLLFKNVNLI